MPIDPSLIQAEFGLPFTTPVWPTHPAVKSFITTRAGGVSEGRFGVWRTFSRDGSHSFEKGGLNLATHVEDDLMHVEENRRRLQNCLPSPPLWLNQVHSSNVINAELLHHSDPPESNYFTADAAFTTRPGQVLAVLTADCLPLLLASTDGKIVGVVHAGWRGLAQGILHNTIAAMRKTLPASQLMVYLGPAIGSQCYEVGDEVLQAFTQIDLLQKHYPSFNKDELLALVIGAQKCFKQLGRGKWLTDLFSLARLCLKTAGIENIYGGEVCTYSNPGLYYSHRRDYVASAKPGKRHTGRFATVIWLGQ